MRLPRWLVRSHADVTRLRAGRLFRKYFLLILMLVCGALLISSAIGLYFSYQENQRALAVLQREKAVAAAARVEQFLFQIEQQLKYAALPQLGIEGLEQRRIEFLKLLRQADAVTDVAQIDARGREQISESRLKMSEIGTQRDWSQEPAFKSVRPGQTWFGPVYFRKETEPYMSIAVRPSEKGPVTVADVNLKFIWDVVSRIQVGQKGKAYVVDGSGFLVADPDIGLVLRKTDLSGLEQVKASLKPESEAVLATLARDHAGHLVLSAFAPIELREDRDGRKREPLGWKVFVEQPVSEVYAGLKASAYRSVALMVAGVLFSILAAMWLAGTMVRPIRELQEGAQKIGEGDLDTQISVSTGDELQALAGTFNKMTAQLRESYAGLERKVEERTAELKQTLERQTATAEILKVISSSPTDDQPVFEAIVASASHLFGRRARIRLVDGNRLVLRARSDPPAPGGPPDQPLPIDRNSAGGRVVLDRAAHEIVDTHSPDAPPSAAKWGAVGQYRAIALAPLMRQGAVIGVISVMSSEPGGLGEKQMALLRTFADQAVIAIENVRLFKETKEALERQKASADVLGAISSSIADTKPVFDRILSSCERLFAGRLVGINLVGDDGLIRIGAFHGPRREEFEKFFPIPAERDSGTALAILERRVLHYPDVENGDGVPAAVRRGCAINGVKACIFAPMLWEGRGLGAIFVGRDHPGAFSEKDITLLKTFADQAAIAIENVRLFNETKEALDQQTATSDVLRIISSSPSELKGVFEAILANATSLCEAAYGGLWLREDDGFRLAALHGALPAEQWRVGLVVRPAPDVPLARVVETGKAVHIVDMREDKGYVAREPLPVAAVEVAGMRTLLLVPMLKDNRVIGEVAIYRTEVRAFTERQIALIQNFADQAVIAIENVRLFNETKEALERQTATADILRVISGSQADVAPVFNAIVNSAVRLIGGYSCVVTRLANDQLELEAFTSISEEADRVLKSRFPIPANDGSPISKAVRTKSALFIADTETDPDETERGRSNARARGYRSILHAPMVREGTVIGVIHVTRTEPGPFTEREVELLKTFADQAVIAIENVRLFREIQEKSAQLEIANKHKSDFLANMSHELRTPLNAIIGFSEVLIEKMFGEVNDKQLDYLKDIHESGRHLLSLINDILDLSKIEAGRMDLEVSTFHLPTALSNAMTLVRERAQRHGIALDLHVDKRLAEFSADERKFKQILVNLLSNAVKFTPDGGKVEVSAKLNGKAIEIAVRDTGIGIAPEDQQKVFAEFVQVGRDYTKKAEGTGLGLALTKRFVELHGGEIALQSAPGEGSTFTVKFPLRAG